MKRLLFLLFSQFLVLAAGGANSDRVDRALMGKRTKDNEARPNNGRSARRRLRVGKSHLETNGAPTLRTLTLYRRNS